MILEHLVTQKLGKNGLFAFAFAYPVRKTKKTTGILCLWITKFPIKYLLYLLLELLYKILTDKVFYYKINFVYTQKRSLLCLKLLYLEWMPH